MPLDRPPDLAEYHSADHAFRQELAALGDLVADNPKQVQRARELEQAMLRSRARTREGVIPRAAESGNVLRDGGEWPPPVSRPEPGALTILHAMQEEEVRLLQQRGTAADRSSRILVIAGLAGVLFSLAVLGWVFSMLAREIRQRKVVERKLQGLATRLQEEAITDPLTGLYNRRYLSESLEREVARCTRRSAPLALLMFDVDHFRQVNATYGHPDGDEILKAVARVIGGVSRKEDIACRLGGEEFVLVMPEAVKQIAVDRAETIREAVALINPGSADGLHQPITISVGVACLQDDGATGEELLRSADVRLYRAKNGGRNRTCFD